MVAEKEMGREKVMSALKNMNGGKIAALDVTVGEILKYVSVSIKDCC